MDWAARVFRGASATCRVLATLLALAMLTALTTAPASVSAQVAGPPVGSMVMVSNTGGQRLNLRAGPAASQPILARLNPGEILTVTGPGQTVGITLWVPVRPNQGQPGWVSAEFVVLLSAPSPASASAAETTASAPPAGSSGSSTERDSLSERNEANGAPGEVEAKLKYPEVKGREQEITVWVTRGGAPVPGVIVTLESSDGEEGERFRELDPTNDEGRTRRVFDVRHEKGTVEIQVEAVAPDGGEGRAIVSYFRR